MMIDILKPSKYTHEKGIVHRDLKPELALMSYSSKLKVQEQKYHSQNCRLLGFAVNIDEDGDDGGLRTVRYCLNLDAHILTVLLYIHAKLVKS
jgi:serine/threonine protein kinase